MKSAVPLSLARAAATDPEMLHRYYDTLEDCLRNNEIFDDPGAIFNCDETGLALNPPSLRVVQEVGSKAPNFVTGGDKSQMTVLVCTCASGYPIPPYVIFDRLTWNPKLAEGEVPGSLYGLSNKSWINSKLFHSWFVDHFLKYVPRNRPLILLLDGHSSHYCPATIKYAAKEGILMYVLPPNTTHLTQPLDKGCFSPLKVKWRQVCQEFKRRNPGRVVTRFDFSKLFAEAWYDAMSPKNIASSFKTTGICPFNRHALKVPGMEKGFSLFHPESLLEQTGLKYIPFYSPGRRSSTPRTSFSCSLSSTPKVTRKDLCPPPDTISARFQREASVPLPNSTTLTKFLNLPTPPNKCSSSNEKSCGKCITSVQGLRELEAKEKLKEEKIRLKQEAKEKRALQKQLKGKKKRNFRQGT